MRIFLIAIISWSILGASSHAAPQKYASGVVSLDAFLASKEASSNQLVVGMTGFYGQDQPQQWLILTRSSNSTGLMQEFVVSEGRVQGVRKVPNLPNQDLPVITISRKRIKVDSNVAFEIAEGLAETAKVGYDSVHYQLRCRDQNEEPVWMVNLLDPAGRSVGIHYISAESGTVLRSVWHRSNRHSLSATPEARDKPVSLLYGGNVREITVSGNAGRQKRRVTRIITPKAP